MKSAAFRNFLLLAVVILLVVGDASGQCAMCKQVVESSDSDLAKGLNSGILYLMGIPYLLLIGVGVLLFRKLKSRQADAA